MQAELISIGTELLLGEITDTNATTIAQALTRIGLDLIFRTTVGDNEQRITQVIDLALARVDVVITSGGLGPTVDDVTREAVAQATGRPLVFHPTLLDQIADRFRRFDIEMSDNNKRQAHVPQGAIPIENPVGTAPIFILKTDRGVVMTLPGVPREMKYLLENALIPWLKDYLGEAATIQSLILRTVGIGESQIDTRIADLMTGTNPTVGLAAHSGQTDIRITAKAKNEAEAQELIQPIERELRRRLGSWIYTTGTQPIEETVYRILREQQVSISSIEAGTDGLLSQRLHAGAGEISDILTHNQICETIEDLGALIGSPERDIQTLAKIAAQHIRANRPGTYGLAAIIRETGEGLTEAGVAVATENICRSRIFSWTAERADAPTWVTTHCLALLWQMLLKSSAVPEE
ncbi:MAG: CinA family nicotinamide mononucleotide deamidase-related protein [Anaerolineae bacterium]|nr:CinA family nicotinamide mononucleotide deamidase-related protein [Anaerolineae bacterium]